MPESNASSQSPDWSSTVKLVVGLTIVGLVAALIITFRSIIGPLLMAIILAYVLHPVASKLSESIKLSWRASVSIVFFLLLIVLIFMLTATGLAIFQQLEGLFRFVDGVVTSIPDLVADLSVTDLYLWGYKILDFSQFDIQAVIEQLIGILQPILGSAGGVITSFATSAAVTFGWGFFILIVAYFVLADTGRFPDTFSTISIPGYDHDVRRLGRQLGRIWNSFMRGQVFIFMLVIVSTSILMTVLGVRNPIGIAILMGFAKFIPYLGPLVAIIVTAIVAFFQESNYIGLDPVMFSIVVVVSAIILDQIIDNLVTPRIFGRTLGVHPAAILVAAFIAANLIGIVGLLLAAPVLATSILFGRYMIRKLLDMDPFPDVEMIQEPDEFQWWQNIRLRISRYYQSLRKRRGDDNEHRDP